MVADLERINGHEAPQMDWIGFDLCFHRQFRFLGAGPVGAARESHLCEETLGNLNEAIGIYQQVIAAGNESGDGGACALPSWDVLSKERPSSRCFFRFANVYRNSGS